MTLLSEFENDARLHREFEFPAMIGSDTNTSGSESAGRHKPVIPVVIFLTPLSSNFEIKRIDRPTFLLFAPY